MPSETRRPKPVTRPCNQTRLDRTDRHPSGYRRTLLYTAALLLGVLAAWYRNEKNSGGVL